MSSWQQWNERLVPIWAEVFSGHVYLESDENGRPVLRDGGGISLSLAPSDWGLGDLANDEVSLAQALEQVVQGHAPDYWRQSDNPLVQALGWLDKRIGRRSMERWHHEHGRPRSALEQALMAVRDRAELAETARRHTSTTPATISAGYRL